ncbi:YhcH/YjgK/YiaL family protein [Poseidonibacter sp.]|uniref:YhcH/YjgK/YiaL family protein n=1 Tax=Poseidonibacter sp. TaxID=2321188 RepID=UPI003C76E59C
MAIFGKLENLKQQITDKNFQTAFDYLSNIQNESFDIKDGECIKEMINDEMFVLKQAYITKNREDCFFESHKKYIDIQYMLKGEEIMDVCNLEDLEILKDYDDKTDFIKYKGKEKNISSLLIKENELAIFYPQDAHQPCIKTNQNKLIYKAVIKIPVKIL